VVAKNINDVLKKAVGSSESQVVGTVSADMTVKSKGGKGVGKKGKAVPSPKSKVILTGGNAASQPADDSEGGDAVIKAALVRKRASLFGANVKLTFWSSRQDNDTCETFVHVCHSERAHLISLAFGGHGLLVLHCVIGLHSAKREVQKLGQQDEKKKTMETRIQLMRGEGAGLFR